MELREQCWAKLRDILFTHCDVDIEISLEHKIFDDLGLDSIEFMMLILKINEVFGIDIRGQDLLANVNNTVENLLEIILKYK